VIAFGVPILDWLILAIAIGLGVEAWLTTRPTPEEREAARRDAAVAPAPTQPPAQPSVDRFPASNPREDQDHSRN
jgi:hypothetical protein